MAVSVNTGHPAPKIDNRIKILDGFRAIAIIAVMLFHYFSSYLYVDQYYPYKFRYNYFGYGYLGVEFFFIISGFVISYTLLQTNSIAEFWKKRWIRLFPSMLIASIIIFLVFLFVNDKTIFPQSQKALNFLPGLIFGNPELFNSIFKLFSINLKVDYLNGSFWSLWPEIQFYFLASIIYFINRKNFLVNYLICAGIIIGTEWLFKNIGGSNIFHFNANGSYLDNYKMWISNGFNLPTYLIHFTIGVLFFQLYSDRQNKKPTSLFVKIMVALFAIYFIKSGIQNEVRLVFFCMLLLFSLFIYLPSALRFLENKIIVTIGVASYFIYLIHENIGLMLIYKVGSKFGYFSFLFTFVIIGVIVYLSVIYTRLIDIKISGLLKKFLLKRT